jgi:hypothetical protein
VAAGQTERKTNHADKSAIKELQVLAGYQAGQNGSAHGFVRDQQFREKQHRAVFPHAEADNGVV